MVYISYIHIIIISCSPFIVYEIGLKIYIVKLLEYTYFILENLKQLIKINYNWKKIH